jgi:hypothetical protein
MTCRSVAASEEASGETFVVLVVGGGFICMGGGFICVGEAEKADRGLLLCVGDAADV